VTARPLLLLKTNTGARLVQGHMIIELVPQDERWGQGPSLDFTGPTD